MDEQKFSSPLFYPKIVIFNGNMKRPYLFIPKGVAHSFLFSFRNSFSIYRIFFTTFQISSFLDFLATCYHNKVDRKY